MPIGISEQASAGKQMRATTDAVGEDDGGDYIFSAAINIFSEKTSMKKMFFFMFLLLLQSHRY